MSNHSSNSRRTDQFLLKKVLLPYIVLLSILAIAITFGSKILFQNGLREITKTRIEYIQNQVYNDFKKLEQLLTQSAQKALQLYPATQEQISQQLQPSDRYLTIEIVSSQSPELPLQIKDLLDKTAPRNNAYVTVLQDAEHGQILIACQKVDQETFLLLHHPLGRSFLNEIANRYVGQFYLLDQSGALLASDNSAGSFIPAISNIEIERLLSDQVHSEIIDNQGPQLISIAPLPLGHDRIYLLGISQPLSEIEALIQNNLLYLLGIIGLALLVCITLFRSLLHQLFSPLNSLLHAYEKVSQGEDSYRIQIHSGSKSQLTQLCLACNQLLDVLSQNKKEIEDLSTQLDKLEDIKEHNQHLRRTNLELETRTVNLREQNQEFSALFQVTQTMVSSLDQQLLYEKIVQALKDSLGCPICVLYSLRPGSETLDAVKVQGIYGVELKSIIVKLGEGLAGEAALNQKLGYIPDLSQAPIKPCYGNETIAEGSLLSVPMTIQNRLTGVINLHQPEINAFGSNAQQIAQAIANQAAIAIENARLYEKTKTLSSTDELTGLSNRRQFQEYLLRELAQSRRHHHPFSILMIDIDHFKLYNDFHGHLKGDIVLKRVASLLMQNTRGVDLVARFGGEEFVLLLPKSDQKSSLAVAEKLRMSVEKEVFSGAELSQPAQRLTISIGISHFPEDSSDIYDLLNLADTALYEAKKQGRNKCIVWHSSLKAEKQ